MPSRALYRHTAFSACVLSGTIVWPSIPFMPTAISTNSFVRQQKRFITGVRIPQKSGRDFGMWATPRFRPDVHPVRTETVHGSRISGMYTFDNDVWPGLARYWYTAFRIHVRHRCLHLFRPVLHVCGIFYLMGHKTILLFT
jgi:hypothetical protein